MYLYIHTHMYLSTVHIIYYCVAGYVDMKYASQRSYGISLTHIQYKHYIC